MVVDDFQMDSDCSGPQRMEKALRSKERGQGLVYDRLDSEGNVSEMNSRRIACEVRSLLSELLDLLHEFCNAAHRMEHLGLLDCF